VTHDQEEALSISDRIAIMREGHIEQVGTPEEVYSHPVSRYVARFIGSPQMDILEGSFERDGSGGLVYRVGEARFPVPESAVPAGALPAGAREVDMGIRPEHILVGAGGVAMTTHVIQPLGPMTYLTVGWEGGTLTSRVQGISHVRPGEAVRVTLSPEGLLFFDRETGRRINPGE